MVRNTERGQGRERVLAKPEAINSVSPAPERQEAESAIHITPRGLCSHPRRERHPTDRRGHQLIGGALL